MADTPDRSDAIRRIESAQTRADLRAAYRAYIGRRRSYCVLGPEYQGCCNTGQRARIAAYPGLAYVVGTELEPRIASYRPSERKKAFSHFIRLAWKTQRFNLHARQEIAQARKQLHEHSDPSTRMSAALRLADHGAL